MRIYFHKVNLGLLFQLMFMSMRSLLINVFKDNMQWQRYRESYHRDLRNAATYIINFKQVFNLLQSNV